MNKLMLTAAAATVAFGATAANLMWVGGSEGDWNDAANWEPAQIPTQNDNVFFDSQEAITVNLAATQAHNSLSVSNTPSLTFKGLETGSVMQVCNDSKTGLNAPIVFDENVRLHFIAGKVWTNNSTIDLLGGVSAVSGSVPQLGGTGLYTVRGPVDFPSGVYLAAPTDWAPSSATAGTFYYVTTRDWRFNEAPASVANYIRFSGNNSGGFAGSAPVVFKAADGSKPTAAIQVNVNPALQVARSMPTVFEDWFALCNSAACNNNRVGFSIGSAANLDIPADITTANDRSFVPETATGGFKLTFFGSGAKVRLTGDNTFDGASDTTTELVCQNWVGYNAVEIDGAGDTIHPFGKAGGKLYTNCGHGVFIRPLSSGKTLDHAISYGASVNNNNAYSIGFDGDNDLTVAGDVTLSTVYTKLPVLGDMTLTLAGTVDPKNQSLDLVGTGNVVLGPESQFSGSSGTLYKHGSGTLTLQGALTGTSYNKLWLSGGRTVLDYSAADSSRLNTAGSALALNDALRLRGAELVLKGGSFTETVGANNWTLYQYGLSKIRRDGGSSKIDLGKLVRQNGASGTPYTGHGAVDLESGVAIVHETAGTVLNGSVTVGGDHFATVAADGTIVAADDSVATVLSGGYSTHARTVADYIVIESTADGQTLTMDQGDGAIAANKDGVIFRGSHDYTIAGGWMGGMGDGLAPFVFTHSGTGVLTYTGALGYPSYNRKSFTKSGPGTFRHEGQNNLTVALNLFEGVFEMASANAVPAAGTVYLNGGTLKMAVDATLARPLSVGDNGGTVDVAAGRTLTSTGDVASTAEGTSGPVVKAGEGTWVLGGDFSAKSELRIAAGTARLGRESGIGCSTNNNVATSRAIAPTKILAGGMLDVAGFKAHVGNVYLKGGRIVDSAGGGSLGAYTFYAESGEVAVPLTNVANPCRDNFFVANNLEKTTDGTLTLSAANAFTGTAYVHGGKLLLTGSLAGTACVDGGVLEGSGSIAGYAYATKGGAIAATPGSVLTFGGNLAVGDGGALRVAANRDGFGAFQLATPGTTLYIGEDAVLDFDLAGGSPRALVGEHVIVDLPEGATAQGAFSNFHDGVYVDAQGNKFAIRYDGGDGNDITLSTNRKGLFIMVR